ncbi:MAG: hypothetical protein LAO20_19980 [Acidobacteriia bacterium]|nr:hypothetical protein [Terriglobia bacterium]
MELLERYLQAVRGYLPDRRRNDIVKELGDNILSQMEDRAEELGRSLTEAEQAAIIKQHGHPIVAAARYRRLPMQQLIGSELFPIYWLTLEFALLVVAAFHVVLSVVFMLSGHTVFESLAMGWGDFWIRAIGAVGKITIIFALVEYFTGGKIPFQGKFNPLELPALRKSAPPRGNSVAELVLGCLFLVGWPIFLHSPAPAFVRGLAVRLSPSWIHFEIPMLLAVALGTASAFVALYRPQFPRLRAGLRLTSDVTGVVTFYFLLLTGQFVVPNPGFAAMLNGAVQLGSHTFTAGQVANYGAALGPAIALLVFFIDAVVEVALLMRRPRPPVIVSRSSNGVS